jgi:5S rRNA maturation endonuclease (ribonuclease M5)
MNNDFKEDTIKKDFNMHLDSLKEIYAQSTLKEKHKLNEHIKHILHKHENLNTKKIEEEIKDNT